MIEVMPKFNNKELQTDLCYGLTFRVTTVVDMESIHLSEIIDQLILDKYGYDISAAIRYFMYWFEIPITSVEEIRSYVDKGIVDPTNMGESYDYEKEFLKYNFIELDSHPRLPRPFMMAFYRKLSQLGEDRIAPITRDHDTGIDHTHLHIGLSFTDSIDLRMKSHGYDLSAFCNLPEDEAFRFIMEDLLRLNKKIPPVTKTSRPIIL